MPGQLLLFLPYFAAAVVFVRIGERLYERPLPHTSGKLTYREVLRSGG